MGGQHRRGSSSVGPGYTRCSDPMGTEAWALARPPLCPRLVGEQAGSLGPQAGAALLVPVLVPSAPSPVPVLWCCGGREHRQAQPAGPRCCRPRSHRLSELRHPQCQTFPAPAASAAVIKNDEKEGGRGARQRVLGAGRVQRCWRWHPRWLPMQGLSTAKPQPCKAKFQRRSAAWPEQEQDAADPGG